MSDIPEDIIDSASALAGDLANTPCPTAKLTLIRNAIMAERERCAKEADKYAGESVIARVIASDIRER